MASLRVALIGPPGAGKSTIGRLLAAELGVACHDADVECIPYYEEAGWPLTRLRRRITEVGYERAHAEWEEALAHGVTRLVETTDGVHALGAGHTHITRNALRESAARAFARYDHIVLLRPDPDLAVSVEELRRRCIEGKGRDWRRDGIDWLVRWSSDGADDALATMTHWTAVMSPEDSARTIADGIRRGSAETMRR